MIHIMIDLETAGVKPTAPIVAIGAVAFNLETGEIGKTFYERVDILSAVEQGAIIEPDAFKWWLRQDAPARSEIAIDDASHIDVAINNLSCFFISQAKNPTVWANGASFDFTILKTGISNSAYSHFKFWDYWNEQDTRAILSLGKRLGIDPSHDIAFDGTKHHAMYDAIHQAKQVSYIWRHITNKFDDIEV